MTWQAKRLALDTRPAAPLKRGIEFLPALDRGHDEFRDRCTENRSPPGMKSSRIYAMKDVEMSSRRSMVAVVLTAAASSALFLSTATEAFAQGTAPTPQQAVHVVEKVTGTADLAPAAATASSPARAVTQLPTGTVSVVAPMTSTGAVALTVGQQGTLTLGLPGTTAVTGVRSGDSTVVYPNAAEGTDLAVQPTKNGGARTLITLKDAAASTTWRFPLGLPQGAEVHRQSDGRILVVKGARVLGAFEAPWAKDANGRAVPTGYRLEGTTLVQVIATDANTAFPVVADPWWDPTSWDTSCLVDGLGAIGGGLGAIGTVAGAPETGGASLAATGSLIAGAGSAIAGLKDC
ncbi:hypothetical protein [Kitasatospora sp. LaBMicrA B282]|uniref:hypothetical protein n=1 Tax=Kitasatospora sp. LaBMicrA B282 TaxID=3420949 RepID=UPI003D0D3E6D